MVPGAGHFLLGKWVRGAHRGYRRSQPRPDQRLLIAWPKEEKEPAKYRLSNLPAVLSLRKLAATAKLRWRSRCCLRGFITQ